jgi:hypothetical protein
VRPVTGLRQAFLGVRQALEIAQVTFAIGGSWASTTHGEPRQTNDIDLVAAFNRRNLDLFLDSLGDAFYYDRETAQQALRLARPFNVVHRLLAFKFDFFPVHDEHGAVELERRQYVLAATLDAEPVPIVTAEDIVIAKLRWYRAGGEVSQQQWRDVLGVLRLEGSRMDDSYLDAWTRRLGLDDLCQRARQEAAED